MGNLQGSRPDWQLLRSSLQANTARVERLNLSDCGGDDEEIGSIVEALALGPIRSCITKLSAAGDGVSKPRFTTLPWQKLALLQELQELDLESGNLKGPLPAELFKLTNLRQL